MLFLFLSLHRMWYAHFVHTLFRDTATTEIYTLSLHDALPISIQSDPQPKEEPIEKPIIKEDRKPFKPSRVPSPIYGYQKREEIKKVENIPTFVRKQTAVDDEQQIERPIVEEKPAKVSTESRPPAEPIAPETKQAAVKQEEPKEPITITREKETEKADVIDPQERIEAKEKQTKRIHSKQRSKDRKSV